MASVLLAEQMNLPKVCLALLASLLFLGPGCASTRVATVDTDATPEELLERLNISMEEAGISVTAIQPFTGERPGPRVVASYRAQVNMGGRDHALRLHVLDRVPARSAAGRGSETAGGARTTENRRATPEGQQRSMFRYGRIVIMVQQPDAQFERALLNVPGVQRWALPQ